MELYRLYIPPAVGPHVKPYSERRPVYIRDTQAERDAALGAAVRAAIDYAVARLAHEGQVHIPLSYMKAWTDLHGSALGQAIVDALEAEGEDG